MAKSTLVFQECCSTGLLVSKKSYMLPYDSNTPILPLLTLSDLKTACKYSSRSHCLLQPTQALVECISTLSSIGLQTSCLDNQLRIEREARVGRDEMTGCKKLGRVDDRRTDIAVALFPAQPISSEQDTFSEESSGDPMKPGDLGGSGLYSEVCLCSNSNFLGLRSCDCSLIVLKIRLLQRYRRCRNLSKLMWWVFQGFFGWSRKGRGETEEEKKDKEEKNSAS